VGPSWRLVGRSPRDFFNYTGAERDNGLLGSLTPCPGHALSLSAASRSYPSSLGLAFSSVVEEPSVHVLRTSRALGANGPTTLVEGVMSIAGFAPWDLSSPRRAAGPARPRGRLREAA
jgi:hypothetical protein